MGWKSERFMLKRGEPRTPFGVGKVELWRCESTTFGETEWERVSESKWLEMMRDGHETVTELMSAWRDGA